MAAGTLKNQTRKLEHKIADGEVFVRDLVNADLDQIDEVTDEYNEVLRARHDLQVEIGDCDDAEERKQLRARARELTKQLRVLDTRMLGLYIEDKTGEPFADEVLADVPVRIQTALIKQSIEMVHGKDDEGPTTETSATG
jgi:hypothetical protein